MEYIGIGILVAIGFYFAPVILTLLFGLVVAVLAIPLTAIAFLFGKK